jgi:hypothetical protein
MKTQFLTQTPNLIRNLIAIATVATLLSSAVRSTATELKPLIVIGIPLDQVTVKHPVPAYPRMAQVLAIAGDVELLVKVEQGQIVNVTPKSGSPMVADFSSHWVRRHWQFKPSITGQYSLPISYKLRSWTFRERVVQL